MRIALLAPAWFAVPPVRYGGIEWVVSHLADGLVDRGHAAPDVWIGGSDRGHQVGGESGDATVSRQMRGDEDDPEVGHVVIPLEHHGIVRAASGTTSATKIARGQKKTGPAVGPGPKLMLRPSPASE